MEKLSSYLCPSGGLCEALLLCCNEKILRRKSESRSSVRTSSGRSIRKEDIQYLIDHQPIARFDSITSHGSVSNASIGPASGISCGYGIVSGRGSSFSVPYPANFYTSLGPGGEISCGHDSPKSPGSFRERVDSDQDGVSSIASVSSGCEARSGTGGSGGSDRRRNYSPIPNLATKPIIDTRPIEFWSGVTVPPVIGQSKCSPGDVGIPRTRGSFSYRRRLPSETEISIEDLKPDLYRLSSDSGKGSGDLPTSEPGELGGLATSLTDEQKLEMYRLGEVHFSLQYEIPSKILKVKVIEARDLPRPCTHDSSKTDLAHSNPYAKVLLLPDQKTFSQTAVQKKTQDPIWEEQFTFSLSFREAQDRILEITVKDFDKFSRHCVIGQVQLPLNDINLIKGGHMWKPLQPSTQCNPDLGEMLLSLNFLPAAGRLNVDIIKAKHILQTELSGGADSFVKVTLCVDGRAVKCRKTTVKHGTLDPVFNEPISFNVTSDQLTRCSLVVSLWDHNSKTKDELIGRIVMGRQSSSPDEASHWNQMIHCQRCPVAQWHTFLTREECQRRCRLPTNLS